MLGLIKRNLLVYFKNKSSILFSMLTPIIILVLYLFFLKVNLVDAINSAASAIRDLVDSKDIDSFINGLLLCGIMGSAMITVPYNTLTSLVNDRESKVDYDLSATPIKRPKIILSYYISSALSAFIMTSVVFTIGLVIISLGNPMHIGTSSVIALYGLILLGSMSATAIFMPMLILFKNTAAVSAFMGIISAASGFVIGAYIPLYQFSEGIQTFCNLFPATGITALLKKTMLGGLLTHIDEDLGGLDSGAFTSTLREVFGFSGKMFGNTLSGQNCILYIAAVTALFIFAIAIIYPKVYKRK